MKIIFVRHGQDSDHFRGGWSDLDLIPEGIQQAKQLALHLKKQEQLYHISHIISSDLTRAMTTAGFASSVLDLPIQKEPALREINNGDLAGMPNDLALEKYPGLFFSALHMDEPYPHGESPREFYLRIRTWFSDFCACSHTHNDTTLVITHGGVINIIYHLVKGLEWNNQHPSFPSAPCSVHTLNLDTMEFEVENDTDFLLP